MARFDDIKEDLLYALYRVCSPSREQQAEIVSILEAKGIKMTWDAIRYDFEIFTSPSRVAFPCLAPSRSISALAFTRAHPRSFPNVLRVLPSLFPILLVDSWAHRIICYQRKIKSTEAALHVGNTNTTAFCPRFFSSYPYSQLKPQDTSWRLLPSGKTGMHLVSTKILWRPS